jgi:hypothetical protein
VGSDVDLTVAQIEGGNYAEYTADTIGNLADEITGNGREVSRASER